MDNLSSIDRFLVNKGYRLVASEYRKRATIGQFIAGGLCAAVGVGLAVSGYFSKAPDMAAASAGPFMAAFINLGVATGMRKRWFGPPATDAVLTDEARTLLLKLSRHVVGLGGPFCDALPRRRGLIIRLALQSRFSDGAHLKGTSSEILDSQTFKALDGATFQYNRISALLEGSATDPAVKKMSQSVQLASDETYFDVLHHASLMSRYPENASASLELCSARTQTLKELADRLEGVVKTSGSIPAKLSAGLTVDAVLEDLRLEQLARTELNAPTKSEELQQRLGE